MLLSLIVLSITTLVICDYEVGFKYNYFYNAESAFITKRVDSPPLASSFNFSCIASITCLSANEHGFQFKLELTGIHLIQIDTKGIIISDGSGLKLDAAFRKEFIFTIFRTGAVGEVKHFEGESEDILDVKVGIVSQFISLGDNETDGGPTETLDNQGMYLSHWKREKNRGSDGVVELTRRYTDKDFIHHHDKTITEDSFLLDAFERKKMKSGVVTTSAAKQTLLLAGKEFHKRGRRLGDDIAKRKKIEAGNYNFDDDIYNGTEISSSSSSSLEHINTVGRRNRRTSSFSNMGADAESFLMKEVPYFNRVFYADRVKKNQAQKSSHSHSESTSSSFASLAKKKKKNQSGFDLHICDGKDEDDKDKKNDTKIADDWVLVDKKNEGEWKPNPSFFHSPTPSSLTREEIFRLNDEARSAEMDDDEASDGDVEDRDWEKRRLQRIHQFSLGGFNDVFTDKPPTKKCAKMDPFLEPKYPDWWDYTYRPQYLKIRDELVPSVAPPSSASSTSLLSPSPFVSGAAYSSNGFDIDCPEGRGLTHCYQVGGGKETGNKDFGTWVQAVIYSGTQKQEGAECLNGCNYLLDIDTGVYVILMGKNITIVHLAFCSYRVSNFKATGYVAFNLFMTEFGCTFQDTGCGQFKITICEFKEPIPDLGFKFTQKVQIFKVEFLVGLFAYFNLALIFEVCPPNGSVSASLPPTVGLSFGVEVEVAILGSKLGAALVAFSEFSLIPECTLDVLQEYISLAIMLKLNGLEIKFEITFKICLFILPCWGDSFPVASIRTPSFTFIVYDHYWKLPWTSNDAYGGITFLAKDEALGIEKEMGSSGEYGRASIGAGVDTRARAGPEANLPVREVLDALLDDSGAGASANVSPDAHTHTDAGAYPAGGV